MAAPTEAASMSAERLADDATVIKCSWQDANCFGEIFHRHAPQLHRYVARRLGASAADDIVAQTFYTAFRVRKRYDVARPDARPWLWRIATNLVRQHHRSETRLHRALARTGVDQVLDGHADRVAEKVTAQGVSRDLARALAGLSVKDRDVLLLIAWGDMTYEEVAEVLGIPVGTVRSRLNRARMKIRAALAAPKPEQKEES